MCGLVYFENNATASVSKSVKKRYLEQKNRGKEGFGFVSFDLASKDVLNVEKFTEEKETLETLLNSKGNGILFHHRWPTSTPNIREATHPIMVHNARLEFTYFVAHNGVISDPSKLKEAHEKVGYKYTTEIEKFTTLKTTDKTYQEASTIMFNDSEALAVDIAEVIEGKKLELECKGSMAVIVLQCTKEGKVRNLYWGRNYNNPLNLEKAHGIFSLRSEGKGDTVKPDMLFCRSYATGEITEQDLEFPTTYQANPLCRHGKCVKKQTKKTYYCEDHQTEESREEKKEEPKGILSSFWAKNRQGLLPEGRTHEDEEADRILDEIARETSDNYGIGSELAEPFKMDHYWSTTHICEWSDVDLIKEGYNVENIMNWLVHDIEFLERLEQNAKVLKDTDTLSECAEVLAQLEDRLVSLETAIETERVN